MKKGQRKLRHFKFLMMATVSTMAMMCCTENKLENSLNRNADTIKDTIENVTVQSPSKITSFKTDTLSQSSSSLLYYVNYQIIRNYVEKNPSFRMQLPYFAHEDWHNHNYLSKYRFLLKFSPLEYAKLCMHDEISANLAAILTADLEYQLADDKDKVMKKYENTYMGFYFKAVKNGAIKTGTDDEAENEKKYHFLANGVVKMWQEKYARSYKDIQKRMLLNYIHRAGLFKSFPKNYKKTLSHMYTLGGIDFSKYIENDVVSLNMHAEILDELPSCKALSRNQEFNKFMAQEINENFDYIKSFSPSLRRKALLHFFVATKLKYELSHLTNQKLVSNPEVISTAHNKVMYELMCDYDLTYVLDRSTSIMQKHWHPAPLLIDEQTNEPRYQMDYLFTHEDMPKISKFYQYKKMDLTQCISHFNINKLPDNLRYGSVITLDFFNAPPLDVLENQLNQNDVSKIVELPSIITQTKSKTLPMQTTTEKRRLSDEQYVELPDFTEPLLRQGALTETQRQQLKEMYDAFENMETAYKGCDKVELNKLVKKMGPVPYFGKEDPFLRKSSDTLKSKRPKFLALKDIKQKHTSARR